MPPENLPAAEATQSSSATQAAADGQQTASTQAAPATQQDGQAPAQTQQQATDGQGTQQSTNSEGDQGADADNPAGAPEKYEFKAPEGQQFNADVIAKFSEVAKKLNLSQDGAQELLDQVAPQIAAAQQSAFQNAVKGWGESAKADKEFGGDKFDANLAVAKKAIDAFGTPELRTLLDQSGLGNHPEVIRAFYRAGKAISEDRHVPGGTKPSTPSRDAASTLYGNQSR